MWTYPEEFDVIVVGAGHAGCEAAHAAAAMGASTLLLTMQLDTIAKMSCNPAIGGTAKGHLVREIDALGGLMGQVTDSTSIQSRMLNRSKGPAVWSPRAQADKWAYQTEMKRRLERINGLQIKQGTIEQILVEGDRFLGFQTLEGIAYLGKSAVITAGTFMRGLLHIGAVQFAGGRAGDKPSTGLSLHLEKLGFKLGRLKTGTPPRIHRRSIDFSKTEEQKGESDVRFSFDPIQTSLPQVSCHITYTTPQTKELVRSQLHRSAMYSGKISSVGPRYCPSIEDKIVRFADKERHQIFLEPEGLDTDEIYVNGISTSFPCEIQHALVRTVLGLEKAEIMRPAYAIEYDYLKSGQLQATLESRLVEGLFFAGQVNGTTGYEEAAGQGLVAGINAASRVQKRAPFILSRADCYLGVMIDDLITQDLDEPYRIFTSRAEFRLLFRQANAHLRLRPLGYEWGLIDETRYRAVLSEKEKIEEEIARFHKTFVSFAGKSLSLGQLLSRPEMRYEQLKIDFPHLVTELPAAVSSEIELSLKYAGYIERQKGEAERVAAMEKRTIPKSCDFFKIPGLSREAQEKLSQKRPITLGQAARVSGVSPADISILMVALKKIAADPKDS
jgi:tRNA uridine 5-carboxymethylaminomethyl modification enzyme